MGAISFSGLDLDAGDPVEVGRFWAGVLGWSARPPVDGVVLVASDDPAAYPLLVRASAAARRGPNRIHLDLTSPTPQAQQETVARALALGGRLIDVGQTPEDGHEVLADPEGNELCVIEPGNSFLAGTGVVGAINCDGTRTVGHFWSEALGWPLVWDQDEETAIQAPTGGSKITWSGPPLTPRHGRDRIRFVLSVAAEDEVDAAVSRLQRLGATPTDAVPAGGPGASMVDPDGNEFRIVCG